MFGYVYFGQAIFAWVPSVGGTTTPAETFASYNAEVTTFTSWQNTP